MGSMRATNRAAGSTREARETREKEFWVRLQGQNPLFALLRFRASEAFVYRDARANGMADQVTGLRSRRLSQNQKGQEYLLVLLQA